MENINSPITFAIVIAFVVLSLILWLKNPWVAVLGWVATLSIQYELLPEFRLALSDLFVPAMGLTLLFSRQKTPRSERSNRSSLPAFIIIFCGVFLILGNLLAYYNLRTIPQWTWLNKDVGLIDLVVCFFAVTELADNREKLQSLVRVFVLSAFVLNVFALVGGFARYFLDIPNVMIYNGDSLRLAGLMVNPGAYGGFVACALLMQLALLLGNSSILKISKKAQYLNATLLSIGCLMTISRSSLLGLFVGVIALFSFYRSRLTPRMIYVTLATVSILLTLLLWSGFSSRLADDFWELAFSQTTVENRTDANSAAIEMLRENPANPITGIGVGTFLARSEQKLGVELIIHNEFLWLFVETGVLGFCVFVCILVRALRNCLALFRARHVESPIAVGVFCGIISIAVWMQGTEGLWHRHVWLLLALSEVSYRVLVSAKRAIVQARFYEAQAEPQAGIA